MYSLYENGYVLSNDKSLQTSPVRAPSASENSVFLPFMSIPYVI